MIRAEADLQINRPPEEVFDMWADTRNENDWNPTAQGFAKTSAGPIGAGATFTGKITGMGTVTVEIVDYQRPRTVEHRGAARAFRFTSTVLLSPTATGTQLRATGQVEPRGLFTLLTPIMGPMMRKKFTSTMAAFRQAVEARETPTVPRGAHRRA